MPDRPPPEWDDDEDLGAPTLATAKVGDILPPWLDNIREAAAAKRREEAVARAGLDRRPVRRYRGRPTRLHDGLIEVICAHLRNCQTQDVAAELSGVAYSTFRSWKKRGMDARAAWETTGRIPEGQGIYVTFLAEVEQARAEAEAKMVDVVTRSALGEVVSEVEEVYGRDDEVTARVIHFRPPDAKASTWWLERSHPLKYGRRLEVAGPDGGPIGVEVEVSARDLLKKKLGIVAERLEVEAESG